MNLLCAALLLSYWHRDVLPCCCLHKHNAASGGVSGALTTTSANTLPPAFEGIHALTMCGALTVDWGPCHMLAFLLVYAELHELQWTRLGVCLVMLPLYSAIN